MCVYTFHTLRCETQQDLQNYFIIHFTDAATLTALVSILGRQVMYGSREKAAYMYKCQHWNWNEYKNNCFVTSLNLPKGLMQGSG